jgi:hypothetical protein
MEFERIMCPYCNQYINITLNSSDEQNIKCENCNEIFTIISNQNNSYENITDLNNKIKFYNIHFYNFFNIYLYNLIEKIIGISFFILGVYIILNFLNQFLNIGIALIIIGLSFFFLTSEIIEPQESLIKRIIISEKITFMFSIWVFISLIITDQSDFRMFIVTMMVGFLVIKEITKSQVSDNTDKRMKIFVMSFFLAFLMIVAEEIAIFLSN